MFHVSADNAFPYRVCGGQQESGAACVLSRGPEGAVTVRDWQPTAVEEYGYAVPDPLDPDVIYGGRITRWDRRTRQVQDISPLPLRAPGYRVIRTQPVVFSPPDPRTLYFASNAVWKTRDGGRSWQQIVRGHCDGCIVNVVREDPIRRGLLFCGTEQAVYVSFNDGGDWQPLRLNIPATSIRDLIVKGDDLAVATHGRGFWILDDIEPLREVTDALVGEDVHLFTPQTARRIRWNTNSDTPMPPDEPRGEDPPDGAVIDYFLGATTTDVTLEILDR